MNGGIKQSNNQCNVGGCEPLQIRRSDGLILAQPPFPAVWQCVVSISTYGCEPLQIPPAAVSRFKFAVPIVADMLNKRYRRRQFDSADSEFCDLEKPNIKEIHCFRAVDFSLSKNRLIKQYNGMFRQHCLKQFPYRQGINNFVSIPVQLL